MEAAKIDNTLPVKAGLSPLAIIGSLFFIFGFVTWLSSVLIPYLQIACELNNFQSYLVAFAFYISYFVMAIPSAWVLKITGYKRGMSCGLIGVAAGSIIFIPAAFHREYSIFLLGLFVQGAGLAVLQTASNPYVTILGDVESAAKRMSIMGICNGVAGIIAPAILGAVILSDADALTASIEHMDEVTRTAALNHLAQKVMLPYFIITVILVLLAIVIDRSGLPEIDAPEEEITASPDQVTKTSVFHFPYLMLGVFTLFVYVGVEVIAGNTIISYGTYLGIKMSAAKFFTSFTLIGMLVGYLLGILLIPRYISQQNALKYAALLGVAFALGAIFSTGLVSVLFVALLGFANAVMFPAIWPLSISGLGRFTKIGASLMVMAISGGAVLPLIYGWLSDKYNAQQAYWLVVPCYLIIGWFAVQGYRIGRGKGDTLVA
ncbi:sugar MFS transporter [Chitinophaga defluvii]|uniref:Sugar MFS transporter n=1 Tax=Chitinophaga defluvii TaxID=3163343 RepID=A0ABV2T3I5_9BACT